MLCSDMSSDEDLRKLDNSIRDLKGIVEELKSYEEVLVKDKSRFDPDHLLNIAIDVGIATNICKNSYANYIARKS